MPAACKNRPTELELRHLYLEERWTAEQIADLVGVRKITVLRWMRQHGIERRAAGHGLANRGIEPPTAGELERMVHVEHMSYEQIAAVYGVDFTAVPRWLRKHGIRRPTLWETRRKGVVIEVPSEGELRRRIASGESCAAIGRDCGVAGSTIVNHCREYGIEVMRDGWKGGKRFT